MRVVTFGRGSHNDVHINDGRVSHHHCQIVRDNQGRFFIVDLNSTHGTYVNGRCIKGQVSLTPGDIVVIGNTRLKWEKYFDNHVLPKNNKFLVVLVIILFLVVIGLVVVLIFGTREKLQPPSQFRNEVPRDIPIHSCSNIIPDEERVAADLIGHSMGEGKENGYYPKSWLWIIEDGEISDLKILSVEERSASYYRIIVSMRLSSRTRAFDCKAAISYRFDDSNGWQIELIQSLGMDIVKTHRYDNCINIRFTHDAVVYVASDPYDVHIFNQCDIPLEVGGSYLCAYDNNWQNFCIIVPANSSKTIQYPAWDIQVDYIEQP